MTARCKHGVRHPHPCDDCLELDIPRGRSILDHPCWNPHLSEIFHSNDLAEPGPCQLCGTEIDAKGGAKEGARLSWPQPRRGLSKSIGRSGFSVRRGAHHPWDYVLCHNGREIAGVDASDFFPAVREFMQSVVNEAARDLVEQLRDLPLADRQRLNLEMVGIFASDGVVPGGAQAITKRAVEEIASLIDDKLAVTPC